RRLSSGAKVRPSLWRACCRRRALARSQSHSTGSQESAVMSILGKAIIAALAGGACPSVAPGAEKGESAAWRLEAKIPLGNVSGRIDHMAVDLARRRLFVAELGAGHVGIVDLDARRVLRNLTGLKEPQGVAFVPAVNTLYVANGGDGSVRLYRG